MPRLSIFDRVASNSDCAAFCLDAKMMFERNFRHLPVTKDGRLLGIVSLRRLSQWEFEHSKR